MSEKNIMNDPQLKKEAYLAWLGVETKEDVKKWHKVYTPWWSEENIERIIEIYDKELDKKEKEGLKEEKVISEFERLILLNNVNKYK